VYEFVYESDPGRDFGMVLRQDQGRHLALVNGHGDNYSLGNVVQEANVSGPAHGTFPTPRGLGTRAQGWRLGDQQP
jgi:hypothetical protein